MATRKRKQTSVKSGEKVTDSHDRQRGSSYSSVVVLLFAVVSSLVLYVNTLANEFVYDDLVAVVQNPDVRGERPMKLLFKMDFWGGVLSSPRSHKSYRPVTTLLYRFTAALAGMEPKAFHMMNTVVNSVAVGLAVKCIEIVLRDAPSSTARNIQFFGLSLPTFALISSALYVFHPIHTESVNCIVGLADLLAAALGFLAFICHDKSRTDGSSIYLLTCVVLSWMAALAKEPGLMILAVCGAREISRHWLPALRSGPSTDKSEVLSSVVRFVILASTGLAFLLFRKYINGESSGMKLGDSICDNPLVTAETTLSYVLSALFVVTMYVWKLINPFVLLCDYGYNTVPLVEGFDDVRNVATLAAIIGVALLTAIGVRSAIDMDRPDGRILMALAWIFVPLLPASHIITIGTVLAERLLYLPSLGYCMILAIFVERLQIGADKTRKGKSRIGAIIGPALVVLLSLYAQRIFSRNEDWKVRTFVASD